MNTVTELKVAKTIPEAELSAENSHFLRDRIYKESGIVLDETKHYLIESRLLPIVRKEQLGSLNNLCAALKRADSISLRRQVTEAMTTNETLFFRDVAVFDRLRDTVLPQLIERNAATKTLNIWSAASSTGQEAYSLAMLISDLGLVNWRIRILGTDINQQIVEKAQSGKYIQIEVNRGVPAKCLVKYFQRSGIDWEIKPELRRMTEFRTFDLRQSMRSLGHFDIVLCRNVLIYFDIATKKQILTQIRSVLNNKGFLILGSAETTMNLDDKFARKVFGQSVFYEAI